MVRAGWAGRGSRAIAVCAGLCATLAGCRFELAGIDIPTRFGSDGSGVPTDGGGDLARAGFVPSHVAPPHVQEGAASLIGAKDLDTEQLTIDGKAPPAGVIFIAETTHDEWAVLSVRDLEVPVDLSVHGRRGLIVVAVGSVRIAAVIHAAAERRTPGPGGQFTGPGHGGDGKSATTLDSGGGGAGHALAGAAGGPSTSLVNGEGGAGGAVYTAELEGGSGGGDGAGTTSTLGFSCPAAQDFSKGGAGGGAIQLSAQISIEIGASGGIDAGGGGGRGGCFEAASAGGGGGSGGTIWLEAPSIQILGKVTANGGAGGSGGHNSGIESAAGVDGENGKLALTAALGGSSKGFTSGAGGTGGTLGSAPRSGEQALNGGGGGGGVGRIRVRTHATAPITSADTVLSPQPQLTADF